MSSQAITVSIHIIKMMLRAGEQVGIDPRQSMQAVNITTAMLNDVDTRVAIELEKALWDFLVENSCDDFFGLHAGASLQAGEFDVMDYAIRSSANLRQAFENAIRYNRLLHDVALFELVEDTNTAEFQHYFRNDLRGASWQASDFTLASIVKIGKALTGDQWSHFQINFQHDKPADISEYEKYFACPLFFNRERNGISFDKSLLTTEIAGSDPPLHQLLCRHADELLAKLPRTNSLVDQVRTQLTRAIRAGDFGIEVIAEAMNTTSRSLQRRLKEQGTSHQELVEEMRKSLAAHYLENSQLGISEIAYLLGYSEPSAFHRAFKRWFQTTVTHFRKQFDFINPRQQTLDAH